MIRGLATGLAYAHARGIVHCDFKPGNAYATADGTAKILDFGIARLARETDRAADAFDAGRFCALTPRYATPEMLKGAQPHTADDVYALGLVAYELLSGRHPFDGRSADEVAEHGLRPTVLSNIRGGGRDRPRVADRSQPRWPDAQSFLQALQASACGAGVASLAAALALAAGYSSTRIRSRGPTPFESPAEGRRSPPSMDR
jgi:serine/threonine protein kinase